MSRRLPVVVAAALVALAVAAAASADVPAATTGPASSIGARSAIVGGSVNPGGESTTWLIEYGTTTAYGARSASRSAGNGTSAVDVSQQLSGLATGVTYHYRVVATNEDGTSRGADMTLTTRGAPEVVTANASSIGPTAANVGGTVDPNGRATNWWIEYGTTDRYGSRTGSRSAGSGVSPVAVSVRLTGLAAGATYHFRVVAANDIGTTAGADRSFRTDAAPAVSTGSADAISVSSARVSGRVDPRGRGTVVWFEYGTTPALGSKTAETDAGFAQRASTQTSDPDGPAARDDLPLSDRRAERRRDDGRSDAQLPDERWPARRHGPCASRGDRRHTHRQRRPGRPRDELVVRDRPDDGVRDAHALPLGGLGSWGRRGLRDHDRARAGHGVPRAPRRPELGGDDERRRRRVPHRGASGRRPQHGVGDLARSRRRPRGRHRRRPRDAGLGRVRPRRRADGSDRRGAPAGVRERRAGLVPSHRAPAGTPLRLPGRCRERRRHGDGRDGDVRHRRAPARRPRQAAPLHDRGDERPRPPGRAPSAATSSAASAART